MAVHVRCSVQNDVVALKLACRQSKKTECEDQEERQAVASS